MAKKKNILGKLLAITGTVAAIGGVCYAFRDKIKENPVFKTITQKLSSKFNKDDEDDFIFDDEDDISDFGDAFQSDEEHSREYTSITPKENESEDNDNPEDTIVPDEEPAPDLSAKTEEDLSASDSIAASIEEPALEESSDETFVNEEPSDAMTEIFPEDTIPTISFGTSSDTFKEPEQESSVSGYEYEGLSDVSEDPDVLEEQDKLDF